MPHPAFAAPRWHLSKASVCGKSHVDSSLPNQDWIEVAVTPDGGVVAVAMCDGAGSALHSDVGARTTCQLMAPCMLEIGIQLQSNSIPTDSIRERITQALERVRARLSGFGNPLADFHCTLVMCVLAGQRGYVCQVGDSIALSTTFSELDRGHGAELDFFPASGARLFAPDRGEYVNETHFITEVDWLSHVRLCAIDIGEVDAVLLMTDGAMDVAMIRGKVFRGFLSNLVGKLLTLPSSWARDQVLSDWLSDPRTHRATSDDKTMFIAIRAEHQRLAEQPFVIDDFGDGYTDAVESPIQRNPLAPDPARPVVSARLAAPQHRDPTLFSRALTVSVAIAICAILVPSLLDGLFPGDIPDVGHIPVARVRQPGELILLPEGQTPVMISVGRIVEFRLQMIRGETVEVLSVRALPETALRVDVERGGCSERLRLTSDAPTCVIRLQLLEPSKSGRYELRVQYQDTRTHTTRELFLPVRSAGED